LDVWAKKGRAEFNLEPAKVNIELPRFMLCQYSNLTEGREHGNRGGRQVKQ
jgi:hypothetical protein